MMIKKGIEMPWVMTTNWILPMRSARGGAMSNPNPIASDRVVLRQSLLASLFEVVERNARVRKLEVRVLDPRIRENLPQYATPGAAGLDLRACLDAPLVLQPGDIIFVPKRLL